MTSFVTGHDGRLYQHRAAGLQTVFIAEQPGMSSAAGTPHTGAALLLGWLDPVQPGAEPLARVRLPNGRLLDVYAGHVASADNLAARRILPCPLAARRTA